MRTAQIKYGALAAFMALFLSSCAVFGPRSYPASEPVLFDGLEFRVKSRQYRYAPITVQGREAASKGVFLVVDLTVRNTYRTTVPGHFQPVFTLVDWLGREYEPSEELSAALERVKPPGELGPGATAARRLVFDLPDEGGYRLRVLVPLVVRTEQGGGTYEGRAFFYRF